MEGIFELQQVTFDEDTKEFTEEISTETKTITQQAKAEVPLTGCTLQKSGEILKDGTINWTITASNDMNQSDPYLYDKLPSITKLSVDTVTLNGTKLTQYNLTDDIDSRSKVTKEMREEARKNNQYILIQKNSTEELIIPLAAGVDKQRDRNSGV